jgi:hypothetical protein
MKLSLAVNNLIIPGQGEFGNDIQAGNGKTANLFFHCTCRLMTFPYDDPDKFTGAICILSFN